MKKEFDWRTGRSCFHKIFLHIVFTTKYRRGAITEEMLNRMKILFSETLLSLQGELLEFNGEDDHVHLMVGIHPNTSISNLIGKLKGRSSYFIRREFWGHVKKKLWGNHFWSPSYCVVSCGGAPLEIVKAYVENQRTPPSAMQIERSKRFTDKTRIDGRWEPKKRKAP